MFTITDTHPGLLGRASAGASRKRGTGVARARGETGNECFQVL